MDYNSEAGSETGNDVQEAGQLNGDLVAEEVLRLLSAFA
jgi:hypothetical protein